MVQFKVAEQKDKSLYALDSECNREYILKTQICENMNIFLKKAEAAERINMKSKLVTEVNLSRNRKLDDKRLLELNLKRLSKTLVIQSYWT